MARGPRHAPGRFVYQGRKRGGAGPCQILPGITGCGPTLPLVNAHLGTVLRWAPVSQHRNSLLHPFLARASRKRSPARGTLSGQVRPFRRRLACAGKCSPLQGRAGKRRGVHGTHRPRAPKTARLIGGRPWTTADSLGQGTARGHRKSVVVPAGGSPCRAVPLFAAACLKAPRRAGQRWPELIRDRQGAPLGLCRPRRPRPARSPKQLAGVLGQSRTVRERGPRGPIALAWSPVEVRFP
jgi:hypothetical protein